MGGVRIMWWIVKLKKFHKNLIVFQNILIVMKQLGRLKIIHKTMVSFPFLKLVLWINIFLNYESTACLTFGEYGKRHTHRKDIGRSIVHKINCESSIKWDTLVEVFCGLLGFTLINSSRQARYHLTFITEGDTVGNVVEWLSDVGRLVEVGTPIRITRRTNTRYRISSLIIVWFNIRVDLKPKGKRLYRWCCYSPYCVSTKTIVLKLT